VDANNHRSGCKSIGEDGDPVGSITLTY